MATCEMCGVNGDLRKTRVEGTTLDLCEDCQDVGEVLDQSTASASTSGPKRSRRSDQPVEELVEEFDRRVKQAREARDMSVAGLAQAIKEKDSVIHRVETGKLSPDRKLARKLERALDISLYEEPETTQSRRRTQTETDSQTLGDVADVRER